MTDMEVSMTGKTKSKRAQEIRDEARKVTVIGTCGMLQLVPGDVEWVNPTTNRVVPGVHLDLGDDGVRDLDPERPEDKAVLDVLIPLIEKGEDPRIAQHAIQIVPPDRIRPPYPNWDSHAVAKCLSRVEEDGFDPAYCLRYEVSKGDDARADLVDKLDALVDKAPEEDPLAVPAVD